MPAWSPDGGSILFVSQRPGKPGMLDLVTTTPDGKTRRTVRERVHFLAAPAWAPDGQRFVFADFAEKAGRLQLVIAQSNGTLVSRIPPRIEGLDILPAWSPDLRRIAYVHFDNEKGDRGDLMIYDVVDRTHSVISWGTLIFGEDGRPSWGRAAALSGTTASLFRDPLRLKRDDDPR